HIAARLASGEKVVGIKLGGALIPSQNGSKNYQTIFGYLTDAMQRDGEVKIAEFAWPRVEPEVVFKLAKDIDQQITLEKAPSYVEAITVGAEILDYRSKNPDPFVEEAIADNAGASGFALAPWVDPAVLHQNLKATIHENDSLMREAPVSAIFGNPWKAVVAVSTIMQENSTTLPAGSILFSSSATDGLEMRSGNTYRIEIQLLGSIELKAI
ncbi:MAG: fumarylacetoacetate hydrolase family protein, partial [Candidatus Planktophila sp.]